MIMPAFNGVAFIEQAIASVLDQCEVRSEIIVVDDGSEDDTAACVDRLAQRDRRILLVRGARGGVATARNRGLHRATAPLVSFLDQDDLKPAGGLIRHVDLLKADPDTQAVVGESPEADPPGPRAGQLRCVRGGDYDFYLRMIEAGVAVTIDDEVALLHRRHGGNASGDRPALSRELLYVFQRSVQRRRQSGQSGALRHPLLDAMRAQWPGG
ncbi:MAG: glycosyltransferase family 2 protein [Rhizobiales bacterium]|nr:glycosyltransferase family 2 protein [Hyphomicrobiales bacterium]